ncbi:Ribosomal L1 domain-containing protein 1 [Lambiella insularis]|nr:Ribosomal L1 domain-containing protein 1 [Lambiella insularis]
MKLHDVASIVCAFAACTSLVIDTKGPLNAYLEARNAWALDSQDPWLIERGGGGGKVSIQNTVPRTVTCVGSGEKYGSSAIKNSVEAGMDHVTAGTTVGKQRYPHIYNGNDPGVKFANCPDNRNRYEFPAQRGSTYDGDDPMTDRVIFQYKSKSSAIYCGIITHARAPTAGGFVMYMTQTSTSLTTMVDSGSPHQLKMNKVLEAATALLKHMKSESQRKATESSTKSLLGPSDDGADNEPLWLVLTTKKHIQDQKRLKPGKIPVPHSLHSASSSTVCIITADPRRPFKDATTHPSFPTTLGSQITRVISVKKLGERYKGFADRRQLLNEHDVFLADDRIITRLPKILGKTFYNGTKRPIPVNLQPHKQKGEAAKPSPKSKGVIAVAPPAQFAKEVEAAISCAQVHLSPSVTTSIRVGSTNFTPEQVAENVEAVVKGMLSKFIPKGWKSIRSLHIKGPETMALPIWYTDQLWEEDEDVLENEEAEKAAALASQKGRKRKGQEGGAETSEKQTKPPKQTKRLDDADMGKEMTERRAKLRQQKQEARDDVDNESAGQKSAKQQEPDTGEDDAKTKNAETITASA